MKLTPGTGGGHDAGRGRKSENRKGRKGVEPSNVLEPCAESLLCADELRTSHERRAKRYAFKRFPRDESNDEIGFGTDAVGDPERPRRNLPEELRLSGGR